MNQRHINTLRVLFSLARDDRPADLALVAAELGASCVETDELLDQLEDAGLVDANRVRLTLSGLTLAVSAGAATERRERPRAARRSASRAA